MASTADILRKIFEVGGIATETFGKVKSLRKEAADKVEVKSEAKDLRKREQARADLTLRETIKSAENKSVQKRIDARAKVTASRQSQTDKIALNIAKENEKRRSSRIEKKEDRFQLWLEGKLPKITDQEKRFFENKVEGRGSTGKATKERDFVKETKEGFSDRLDTRNKIARDAKNRGKDVTEGLREAGEPAQIGSEFDFYNSFIRQFVEGGRAKDSIGAALGDPAAQDRFTLRQQGGDNAISQQAGDAQATAPRETAGQPITQGAETLQIDQEDGAPQVIDLTPLIDPDALTLEEEQLSILLQKERDGLATDEEIMELIRLIQLVETSQIPFPTAGQ